MTDTGDLLDTSAAGPAGVRGGALRVGSYVGGTLVSLVSVAVLFRHLGVDDSGRYTTALSIALLGAGLTDSGLTTIAVREYSTLVGAERDAALRDILGLRIALALLGIAGSFVFTVLAGYSGTLIVGVAVLGLAMLFTNVQHSYGVGLTAELRQGWVSAADVLRQVVTALAIVVLAAVSVSLAGFFWVNVAGAAAAVLLLVAVVRGSFPLRPGFDIGRWKALAIETLPYTLATAVGAIYFRLAIIIVSLVSSAQQTGYFGAAFRGVEVIIAVPSLLVGTLFPILARAARDDRERLTYALGKIVDVSIALGVGVALLLAVGAPTVMRVVAGPDFVAGADVLRIQGVGLAFSFISVGYAYAALSLKLHSAVLRANLVALVTAAVLVPLLATSHDAVGAAVATAIADGLLALVLFLAVRAAGVPSRVDPVGAAKVFAAAALGALPALLTGLPVSVRAILAGAVYAGLVLALRALPEEMREHLPGPLR